MKRRFISICFVMILCFSMVLTACKKNVGTSQDNAIIEESEVEEEETGYTFGYTCMSMTNPYFITLEQSLRAAIEKEGHTLITKDAQLDVEKQIEQIDEMIEEGIDAIFLCPVEWDKITPALENLKEAGVKIINVDSEVKDMDYVDAYIGSNNYDAGYICGKDMIEQFPEGGRIIIVESIIQNSVNDRIRGFEEAIANKGFEVVARVNAMSDLNNAREGVYEILLNDSNIDAIMCGNDQAALGAVVAANTVGLRNVKIYGVDGSPDLKKELIKSDTLIRGTSAQSPINMGRHAAEIGLAVLDGKEYEKITYEDVFFMSADDVAFYGVDGWQ